MASLKKVSIGHNSVHLIFSFCLFFLNFFPVLLVTHCVCLMITAKKIKIGLFFKIIVVLRHFYEASAAQIFAEFCTKWKRFSSRKVLNFSLFFILNFNLSFTLLVNVVCNDILIYFSLFKL